MEHQICIFTGARPNFVKVAPLIRAIQQTVRDLIQENRRYIRKYPPLLLGSDLSLFRDERIALVSYIRYCKIVRNYPADFKKKIDKIVAEKTDGNNLKNYFNNIDININTVDRVLPLVRLDDR